MKQNASFIKLISWQAGRQKQARHTAEYHHHCLFLLRQVGGVYTVHLVN
jgi:hypothetical protein